MPSEEDILEWWEAGDYDRIVREGLPDPNPDVRQRVIEALGCRAHTADLVRLFQLVQADADEDVAGRAIGVLSGPLGEAYVISDASDGDSQGPSPARPGPRSKRPMLFYDDPRALREFKRALRLTQGKRYKLLCELLDICKPEQAREAISELGEYRCSMVVGYGECGKRDEILPSDTVFVAYRFVTSKHRWLRPAVDGALKTIGQDHGLFFQPHYADCCAGHILCDICMRIQACSVAIFDLESADPRPNVALELGLGYGLRKKCVALFEKKYSTQSDIAGFGSIVYSNYKDLQQQLVRKLPKLLRDE